MSVILKGINAALESVGGLLLYGLPATWITSTVLRLTQNELIDDPRDLVARPLHDWALHFSVSSKNFYGVYLLGHGVIKLLLVMGLLRGKSWAYPAALVALAGFVAYQLYRYSYTHSPGLLALSVFDLAVMVLIWREYRSVMAQRAGG